MSEDKTPRRTPRGPGHGGGPMGMARSVQKAKDFKGSLSRLIKYLKPDLPVILLVILFSIGGMIFTIIAPDKLGAVTDEIYKGLFSPSGINFDAINQIVSTLFVLYISSAILIYIQSFLMVGVTQNTVFRMRRDIKTKLTKLPLKFYDSKTHGELISRVTIDVDTVGRTMQQSLNNFITAIVMIIGVVFMMARISWILTGVALITLPLSIFLILPVVKRSQKYFKGQQKTLGDLNGHIEEMYSGHNIVKAYGKEQDSVDEFIKINGRLYEAGWKASFMSGIIMPVINLVNNIIYVLVSVVGTVLFIKNRITVGNIQSFIQYVRLFSQPISNVASVSNLIQSTIAASERVFELLDEEEETFEIADQDAYAEAQGKVSIQNIEFTYSEDLDLIRDFSIDVEAGETIAIVGPTGAGKTTLVNLLLRFYDIQEGDILIDDKSIYDVSKTDLRSIFGMVLQDTWLFKGTIMDNIKYGKLDATDEEVYEVAKIANVDHFIRTLKDGYQTIINEEANNISQGQKQLLTIARALLANPRILILDEATSSVDTRTESYIQNAMLKLMQGRTNFVIAHRLSTIKNASKIIVMNEGKIMEIGNHQELMDKGGFYNKLYNAQFANPIQ